MAAKLISQAALSQLLIVDMQTKLANAMPEAAMQAIVKQCDALLQGAQLLGIATIVTEQYPKGLGNTLPELLAHLPQPYIVEKTSFSCMNEAAFKPALTSDKPQIILAGMEAHICILQTALDLIAAGKQVFLVEDAVISRNPENKTNAIHRLRQAGVIITNTESVLFECLGKAEGDAFKQISKLIR